MPEPVEDKKVAIVGGGPTGIAAAYFLGREGVPTTIFERERKLGGVPRYVIPAFRISDEAIDKDVALMEKMGVEVKLNTEAPSVAELKAQAIPTSSSPWALEGRTAGHPRQRGAGHRLAARHEGG